MAALAGVPLPMTGHKGYAVATMMDVLPGALSGSGMLTEVAGPYQPARRSRSGHFVMALGVAAFGAVGAFEARVAHMTAEPRATPLGAGAEEILHPGEPEARNEARRRRDGLDLPETSRADLANAAAKLGVPLPDGC